MLLLWKAQKPDLGLSTNNTIFPIYFADIGEGETVMLLQWGLRHFENFADGLGILLYLAKEALSKGTERVEKRKMAMTRREFLKKFLQTAAGIYFFSQIPETLSRWSIGGNIDEKSARRAVNRFLIDLNERIHPETKAIILTLRNLLLAQKMETIAAKCIKPAKRSKPEVAIVVGSAHFGIERTLIDKERVESISRLLQVPGLEEARKSIATIARFDFNEEENKWQVTEIFKDPVLAPLERGESSLRLSSFSLRCFRLASR